MGYYYEEGPREEKPPGCLDALLITRAVFGVLLWPVLAIMSVGIGGVILLVLFTVHPAFALVGIAVVAALIWLLARWDQNRNRPPDL